jgi:hypothetical protein
MRLMAALLCALALPATASAAPTATTGDAKAVTNGSATLTATVDPHGASTTVHFEYGGSSSYGKNSNSRTVTSPGTVEIPISGLAGSSTYHYRVVAASGAERTTGADRSFTTAASPPAVATGVARAVTASSATLTGSVDPNRAPTTYHFEYGTTASLGSRTPDHAAGSGANPISVSAAVTGLAANDRIFYRVVASSAGGTRNGGVHSFVTTRGLRSLSIALGSGRVAYGDGVTVSGKLAGAAVQGVFVALQYQPNPFTAPFKQLGLPVRTGRDGSYRFTLDPVLVNARLRVATQGTAALFSPSATVRSVPRVGLTAERRKGRRVRFHGSIRPLARKGTASLQRRAGGRWVTVRRVHLRAAGVRSRYSITTRRRSDRSTYRVMVSPNDGGAHVRGYSRERTVAP